MGKGTHGCFVCRRTTSHVIQVTLREILGWNAKPREHTIDSVQRSYCEDCASVTYEEIARILCRDDGAMRGCTRCGTSPTVCRIQLWRRKKVHGTQQTVRPTITSAYCAECRDAAYAAASAPVRPDLPRAPGPDASMRTFAGARARRWPR